MLSHQLYFPSCTRFSSMVNSIMAEYMYLLTCRVQLHGLCAHMQCYFTRSPDMSTFMEDVRLVRPTEMLVPPRITSMMYDRFQEILTTRSATSPEDKERQRQVSCFCFPCADCPVRAQKCLAGCYLTRSEVVGAVLLCMPSVTLHLRQQGSGIVSLVKWCAAGADHSIPGTGARRPRVLVHHRQRAQRARNTEVAGGGDGVPHAQRLRLHGVRCHHSEQQGCRQVSGLRFSPMRSACVQRLILPLAVPLCEGFHPNVVYVALPCGRGSRSPVSKVTPSFELLRPGSCSCL